MQVQLPASVPISLPLKGGSALLQGHHRQAPPEDIVLSEGHTSQTLLSLGFLNLSFPYNWGENHPQGTGYPLDMSKDLEWFLTLRLRKISIWDAEKLH